jgi:hypothetical protein
VEETRIPGENHRPASSHGQTLSHTVVNKKKKKRKEKKRKEKRTIEINFRGQSRTVSNINIRTHYHTVVNLL